MKNFLIFDASKLTKINAQRRALSQPTLTSVPVLTKEQVLYVPEGQMQGEPATCYNCAFFNYGRSCSLIGPKVKVAKLKCPEVATADAKVIEYWPYCGKWVRGEPNYGPAKYTATLSPDTVGLGWINAPAPGIEMGGANCGGKCGGDDCDNYITKGDDKAKEPTAFCRVLQSQVECGGVCAAWHDDDYLSWDKAQNILKA